MYKEVLRSMEGAGFYQVISLCIFVLFFVTMFLWVVCKRKNEVEHLAALPLEDDSPHPASSTDVTEPSA